MKVFIFTLWLLYPDGTMDLKSVLIPKCPTQEEVKSTLEELTKKGEIKAGMAACEDAIVREARG